MAMRETSISRSCVARTITPKKAGDYLYKKEDLGEYDLKTLCILQKLASLLPHDPKGEIHIKPLVDARGDHQIRAALDGWLLAFTF